MEIISNYSNGNYQAQIAKSFDNLYIVSYSINNKVIKKTNHVSLEQAETIAEDFILEGGSDPQLLNESIG